MTLDESFFEPELTQSKTDQEKIEYAVGYILNIEKVKTLRETGQILKYEGGVYVPFEELEIESITEKLLDSCTTHIRKEVVNKIKALTASYSIKDFNSDFSKLVLENGTLHLDTGILTEYNPEFLTTVKLPVSYEPNATCPLFEKALDDWLSPEDKTTALELMGNILNANRKNFEKSVICIGDGSNGKSTWLRVTVGIIGKENCSSISIHALQNQRFAPAQLYGKLANIYSDISNKELNNLGKFKMAVSGDSFMVEHKCQPHFMMESFAKMFFSANEMPNILDNSDAAFRRILILKWENEFLVGVGRIDDYHETLLQEKSGIFNLMLQHYKNLIKNKGFSHNQSIEDVRQTIKNESDKVRQFVEACLIQQTSSYITKEDLYQKYVAWCKFHNYEPFSIKKLGNRLPGYGIKDEIKRLDKTRMVWIGYNWNFENDWVKNNVKRQEQP